MTPTSLTLQKTYRRGVDAELHAERAADPQSNIPRFTELELAALPAPVQRFIRRSGFVGRPHTQNAKIIWQEMLLRRAPDAAWMRLTCEQFDAVREPTRLAFMKAKLAGVVPFEGLDAYQDGHGSMRMKLLKILPVGDAHGRYMDESALVTLLSEAMFLPSLALQSYLEWYPVDERRASARLTHRGVSVRGTFHFNEADEFVRFDTHDRWKDGAFPERIHWSAEVTSYAERDQLRFPRTVSATWHLPTGDFRYVTGTIDGVLFNVDQPAGASTPPTQA